MPDGWPLREIAKRKRGREHQLQGRDGGDAPKEGAASREAREFCNCFLTLRLAVRDLGAKWGESEAPRGAEGVSE